MVLFLYADNEPDTFITFDPVYSDKQHDTDHDDNNLLLRKNTNLLFDFELVYRRAPDSDSSDSDEDEDLSDLETRIVHQTHEFDRDWLIGGDRDQIKATVFQILDMIQVPSYRDIVHTLTLDFLDLKKREEAISVSPDLERIRVGIDVIVRRFPGDVEACGGSGKR